MLCENCYIELNKTAKFCGNCGTKVEILHTIKKQLGKYIFRFVILSIVILLAIYIAVFFIAVYWSSIAGMNKNIGELVRVFDLDNVRAVPQDLVLFYVRYNGYWGGGYW